MALILYIYTFIDEKKKHTKNINFERNEIKNTTDHELDIKYVKYPSIDDSIVTSSNVEQNGNDLEASTTDYEVLIPQLDGKQLLNTRILEGIGLPFFQS